MQLADLRKPFDRIPPAWRRPLALGLPTILTTSVLLLVPGLVEQRKAEPEAPPAETHRTEPSPALDDWARTAPLGSEMAALSPEADASPEFASLGGAPAPFSATGSDTDTPLDCLIEPYEVVEVGSPVTGRIASLDVERGDMVEAGQVLAELESRVEVAAVELARLRAEMSSDVRTREARLELQELRKQRAGALFASNAVSLDERQDVDTQARVAQLELLEAKENKRLAAMDLARARAMLSRRTVRSPVAGVVVSRAMSPGEVVDDETIMTVAQIDPLRVEVILPSSMFGSVAPGMRAAVVPEFPGDQVHVASVRIVDRVIDAASGTFGVQLELPNPELAIPGGLHCQVRFETD